MMMMVMINIIIVIVMKRRLAARSIVQPRPHDKSLGQNLYSAVHNGKVACHWLSTKVALRCKSETGSNITKRRLLNGVAGSRLKDTRSEPLSLLHTHSEDRAVATRIQEASILPFASL